MVCMLLDAGARVDAVVTGRSRTALHIAAGGGHVDVVRILLDRGADFCLEERWNTTALDIAESGKHGDVAAVLREACTKPLAESL